MNDTQAQIKSTDGAAVPQITLTSGVSENDGIFPAAYDGGIGVDFSKFLDDEKVGTEVFDINADTSEPLKLSFAYDSDKTLDNRFMINLAESKKATVIMNFAAGQNAGQLQQMAINGDATHVFQVSFGYGCAMNFAMKHIIKHYFSSKTTLSIKRVVPNLTATANRLLPTMGLATGSRPGSAYIST